MCRITNLFSILLVSLLYLTAPCNAVYTIQIPKSVDLLKTQSFQIRITRNGLSETQILHVAMPDRFTLRDAHGKDDLEGTIENHEVTFTKEDSSAKTVNLNIHELPVGEWSGRLDLTLSVENTISSSMLESGEEFNAHLQPYDPEEIIFTTEAINGQWLCDVSKAKDGSVNAYLLDGNIYISGDEQESISCDQSMAYAFARLQHLSAVDLAALDFSMCQDVSHMFEDCISLSSISGISEMQTGSFLDASYLFKGCERLTSLNIASWDVSHIADMSHMFEFCSSLKNLNLASWDVSDCRGFSSLFAQCGSLTTTGNLGGWNISQAESLSGMFYCCGKLRNVGDLSSWDTTNVADMSFLFANCGKLASFGDLSAWDVSHVTSFADMFANDLSLTFIADFSSWNVSSRCEDLSGMFQGCTCLSENLDLTGWDVSNLQNASRMFENVPGLKSIDISSWNTAKLIDASSMFAYRLTTSVSPLETIYGIEDLSTVSLKNISGIFYQDQYLNADLSLWDTANLEDISYSFYGTYRFEIGKLKHWNVSSVSDMNECFGDNAGSFVGSPVPEWYQ